MGSTSQTLAVFSRGDNSSSEEQMVIFNLQNEKLYLMK